jgi:hypothetical protein
VFVLLETVYRAFDNIAKRRKVFKVETVGDCYVSDKMCRCIPYPKKPIFSLTSQTLLLHLFQQVAVTGLPEPRKDHAVVMAKFARDCLEKFNELSKQLEITLGPDTGDLAMRGTCLLFI